jgi:hypothetical protein
MTIDQRIERLEKVMGYEPGRVPGTILSRTIAPHDGGGLLWTLSLGLMQDRKRFWTNPTIEECLADAERSLL